MDSAGVIPAMYTSGWTGEPAVPEPVPGQGSGSGLLGLAERVRLYRGTLEAGRRPLGGFRVRAVLPVEQS
jgi:signal transduction histidine kinase